MRTVSRSNGHMEPSDTLDSTEPRPNDGKLRRIQEIVADCLRRRAAGERLSDHELLAGRLDLMPELAEELRRLRLIAAPDPDAGKETLQFTRPTPGNSRPGSVDQGSRQDLESSGRERYGVTGDKPSPRNTGVTSRGLRIRCPHCHEPLEIVADAALIDIPCGGCGNRFSLAGDDRIEGTLGHIGHFELLERLGMGGFGTVWKARDTKLGRTVAVKIPRKGKLSPNEVEEFLREARIAAALKHPHIVTVHEIGRDGDSVYIVSDFVQGWSLSDWRRKQRLTLDESAELCATVATALHYAHEAGVVHRDLKPQNIMLDDQGEPHIMDFGLAKRAAEDVTMTAEGDILGTPAYMSPEQAKGHSGAADRRSDVYSLGVMLFELLTDELPFRGNAINLIRQTIQDEPPRPSKLNGTVPRDLETICLKCLEKEPARRYATALEVAEELMRFRQGEPVLARPLSAAGRVWRWSQRHPLVPSLVASLAAIVLVAYAFGWIYFERACRQLDQELTERALAANTFMAESVAETAGRDFSRRYEAVERSARDPELARLLQEMYDDASFVELAGQLNAATLENHQHDQLVGQLQADTRRAQLQSWTLKQGERHGVAGFAWFVTGPDGVQLARAPLEGGETIGRSYAWRSYFHGGPQDEHESWRPRKGQHLSNTQLSSVFVSQFTDQWVVVVSTPVEREGRFLGVVGLMIELGKFAELPGNRAFGDDRARNVDRFALLVDSRGANAGQVLQHPAYMISDPARRREVLDRSKEPRYAVTLPASLASADYRDPFASESTQFAQRWLVAGAPVKVRGRDTGLLVLVQEQYDELIGSALGHLKRTILWLSLATLGLVTALIVPIWSLVMRVVR